jgi:nucleotide-binding universal stress UspA family protein
MRTISLPDRRLVMAKLACSTPGFEKILVATDGSIFSKAAVDEAIRIAAACSGKLYVILVVEISAEVEMWDASAAEKIDQESRKHLEGIRARAEKGGVRCETVLHFGDEPYRDIVNEAAKRRVTAIVMGSHGRTGLTRLMMGSVVSRVIGHAPCKVLVVPPKRR